VTVDEHLDRAFASLDQVPVRELEAVSEALSHRRHPLHDFASIVSNVAGAREGRWSANLPRYHLRDAVNCADENLLERIADAEAPFWVHVRNAVLAHRKEERAYP
jgi:hypothetical protein